MKKPKKEYEVKIVQHLINEYSDIIISVSTCTVKAVTEKQAIARAKYSKRLHDHDEYNGSARIVYKGIAKIIEKEPKPEEHGFEQLTLF